MAENKKMLVQMALKEQKMLDVRIERATSNARFCIGSKKIDKNAEPGTSKEDFQKNAIASYQKVNDLINYKEAMKRAIVQSNAMTEVEIAGIKMTVAEAIDRKQTIKYKKNLLLEMRSQYDMQMAKVNQHNTAVDIQANNIVATAYGKEKDNLKQVDVSTIVDPYRKMNEYELIDPLNLKNKIEELEREIEDFEANVDTVLQISNCSTWIEFEA